MFYEFCGKHQGGWLCLNAARKRREWGVILREAMFILPVSWKDEAKLELSLVKKEQSLMSQTIQGRLVFVCVCRLELQVARLNILARMERTISRMPLTRCPWLKDYLEKVSS